MLDVVVDDVDDVEVVDVGGASSSYINSQLRVSGRHSV